MNTPHHPAALFLCAGLTFAHAAGEPGILPQPAARWTFDAEFGFNEPDAAGLGPDALLVRDHINRPLSRRVPGLFGRALRPEERSLVRAPFPAGGRFTVSMWILPEKNSIDCFARCDGFFSLGIDRKDNTLVARFGGKRISAPITLGAWSSIVLRCDGGKAQVFLNGTSMGEVPTAIPDDIRGRDFIFSNGGGAHHQFAGLIDEVRVYDSALPDKHIAIVSDKDRCLEQLPPTVDAGVAHSIYLPEKEIQLTGIVAGHGTATLKWSLVKQPEGSSVDFTDPSSAKTKLSFDAPGGYVLKLEAANAFGKAVGTTRLAVFPPHEKRTGKLFANPLKPGKLDPNAAGWGKDPRPVYDQAYADANFPEPVTKYRMEGLDKSRFSTPPPPYQHPRIFFNHSDLADIRHRLRHTRAGRAAVEKTRNAIEMKSRDFPPGEPLPTYFRLKKPGEKNDVMDDALGAIYCNMAFFAMIDADGATARKVIDAAIRTADDQLVAIANASGNDRTNWQGIHHNILARYATSYIYDFLYPWMTDPERGKIREVIAGCTAGKRSIGMFGVGASALGNWVCWVTGDLLANSLAIEGEDGFDPVVYEEAKRAMLRFWSNGTFEDGSLYEGMGKNSITAQNLIALAKRGEWAIASANIHNHATKFLLGTMQPYGHQFIEDDLWGGSRNKAYAPDIAGIKFAYPSDPVVDFVYRNVMGDNYTWSPQNRTYSYTTDLLMCWTAMDWSGDTDWNKNAAKALKDQPLSQFFNYINLVTTRSAWDKDATFLYFLPRMLGGHESPARGTFVFSALGRDWSIYPTGHNNKSSLQHSVVVVDGRSAGITWGKMLEFEDNGKAVFAAADLSEPYGRKPADEASYNDYRLIKGDLPWQSLPLYQLPHWFDGDRPGAPRWIGSAGAAALTDPDKPEPSAFRSIAFVRGARPFAVILDDIQIDGNEHDYRWQMVLPPDLKKVVIGDGQAILTDETTGNQLMVKIFSKSPVKGGFGPVAGELGKLIGGIDVLAFETRCVSPEFTAILIPLKAGEEAPETSLREGIISVGRQNLTVDPTETGRRKMALGK